MGMYTPIAETQRNVLIREYRMAIAEARHTQQFFPELKKEVKRQWAKVEEIKTKLGKEEFK
jgi:hypothetical protein